MKLFTVVCLLITLSSTIQAQNDREAAKLFGVSVVQSFFDNNCDFMFDHLAPTVTSFEGGHQVSITPELRKVFCSESPLRPDMPVTYQTYVDNYKPAIYSKSEFAQKFPEWDAHLNLQADDFFFDGANPIAAGNTRVFRAGDMARFALRKVNGEWTIIAI